MDLWAAPFSELRQQLLGASRALARWQSECRLLAQDWSMGLDSGGHAWEGQHAPDEAVQALLARVDQASGGFWALHVPQVVGPGSTLGGRPCDDRCLRCGQLVLQVYSLRETGEELGRLLGEGGGAEASCQALFAPLALVKALHVSEFSAPQWQAALDEYQRRMAPVEQQISGRLRELFGEAAAAAL